MAFNVLVTNTDDHLRNHGFLREEQGWVLSPAYDLNPVPVDVRPRVHALALDEACAESSFETVLAAASYLGLEDGSVREMAARIVQAVSTWRRVARRHGLTRSEIDRMASAFEHEDLVRAARAASYPVASSGSGRSCTWPRA